MNIINLPLKGAAEITSSTLKDERGWFARYFCRKELFAINGNKEILQINSSFTKLAGTIRGLHLQSAPYEEDKIVRCIKGKIFDVMLDVRLGSSTYGEWCSVILEAQKMNMVYIPKGFAHGFQTLEPNCEVLYLHTQFYVPDAEVGYRYDSPALNIDWPLEISEVSEKDRKLDIFSSKKSKLK